MNALTPEDLAEMLKVNRRTVITTVSKMPGFPKSITGPRKPRWMEDEVRKFLKRQSAHKTLQPT